MVKKAQTNVKTLLQRDEPAEPCIEAGSAGELVESPTVVAELPQPGTDTMRAEMEEHIGKAVGVRDGKLALLLVPQMSALQVGGSAEDGVHRLYQATAALREMDPQNATEAMLAVQMFGVHNAAVMFLQRTTREDQDLAVTDANVCRATRLMRLFNEQLAAMAKMKEKTGQQKVTVEHVHVHSGGQAVVGVVESQGPEGNRS